MFLTIMRLMACVPQVVADFEAMIQAEREATDDATKFKAIVTGLEQITATLKASL